MDIYIVPVFEKHLSNKYLSTIKRRNTFSSIRSIKTNINEKP